MASNKHRCTTIFIPPKVIEVYIKIHILLCVISRSCSRHSNKNRNQKCSGKWDHIHKEKCLVAQSFVSRIPKLSTKSSSKLASPPSNTDTKMVWHTRTDKSMYQMNRRSECIHTMEVGCFWTFQSWSKCNRLCRLRLAETITVKSEFYKLASKVIALQKV